MSQFIATLASEHFFALIAWIFFVVAFEAILSRKIIGFSSRYYSARFHALANFFAAFMIIALAGVLSHDIVFVLITAAATIAGVLAGKVWEIAIQEMTDERMEEAAPPPALRRIEGPVRQEAHAFGAGLAAVAGDRPYGRPLDPETNRAGSIFDAKI